MIVKIFPKWVVAMDEAHLPRTSPMLDLHLALLGHENIIVPFGIDEAFQAVALREPVGNSLTMLPNSSRKIDVVPTYSVPSGRLVMRYTHPPMAHDVHDLFQGSNKDVGGGTSPATGILGLNVWDCAVRATHPSGSPCVVELQPGDRPVDRDEPAGP